MTKDFKVSEKFNCHLQGYYTMRSEEIKYFFGSGPSVNDEGEEDMEELIGVQSGGSVTSEASALSH